MSTAPPRTHSATATLPRDAAQAAEIEKDRPYFLSYSCIDIHEDMIRDEARTGSYKRAIFALGDYIKGKAVCDVGAGTGILSVFCAQAGARKVYAVEASDMAVYAKAVVAENNLSDVIEVIHARVEDIELPEKVDVISMFDSVILARDKWLAPDGLMLPSVARMFLSPLDESEAHAEKIAFWESFPKSTYGISMASMVPLAEKRFVEMVAVEDVTPQQCMSWPCKIFEMDCLTVTSAELRTIRAPFSCKSMVSNPAHSLAVWFEVAFPAPASADTSAAPSDGPEGSRKRLRLDNPARPVILSTAPEATPTHWRQTLLRFPKPIHLSQDDVLEGALEISRTPEYQRFLTVHLTLHHNAREILHGQVYKLKDE